MLEVTLRCLESEAQREYISGPLHKSDAAALSQAISLKRIADTLEQAFAPGPKEVETDPKAVAAIAAIGGPAFGCGLSGGCINPNCAGAGRCEGVPF